jgi:peptide/nickel transport system substrate-binding protein
MRKTLFVLMLAAVFIALTSWAAPVSPISAAPPPAQPTAVPAKSRGAVTDATAGDAVSLNPLLTNDSVSSAYQALIWGALTRLDPQTLEYVGDMFDDNPVLSSDGKTLTWKLRPGLRWSDGKPITAQDVEFTWKKLVDPATQYPAVQFYTDSFTDVKALDDLTVQYTLKQAGFCPAIRNAGLPGPIPQHIYGTGDITQNPANDNPKVVSGLWFFKEWKRDDHVIFSPPYPNYVDGQAKLETYQYRIVKDNTVNTQLFKTQEVDVATPDAVDWEEIKKLPFAQTFEYYSATGAPWDYIGFNLKNPLFADKKVRQAITMAIDVNQMVAKATMGYAKQQYSIYPSSSWAYTEDEPNGVLMKDGRPFKTRIHFNSGNKRREQIAIISQSYLQDVGIQAEVIPEEWNAYLKRVRELKDVDMFVLGWTGGGDPSSNGPIWKTGGSQNNTGYANPEVDKLYDQASNVPGCKQADRKPYYIQIQKIIAEDQPYIFLFTRENLLAVNRRLKVNPLTGLGVAYRLEQWELAAQ